MTRRATYPRSSAGAFTQDYRNDPDAPDAQTLAELLDYLRQRGAPAEVLRAARHCWDSYLRYLRSLRRVTTKRS